MNKFQTELTSITQEFNSSDPNEILSAFEKLKKFQYDLQPQTFYFAPIMLKFLCSSNSAIQMEAINFCLCSLQSPFYEYDNSVSIFKILLKRPEITTKIIKLLIKLESPSLTKGILSELQHISKYSDSYTHKLILHLLYICYLKDHSFLDILLKQCHLAIYDQNLRLSGISILLEIDHEIDDETSDLLISILPTSNYYLFSKIILLISKNSSKDSAYILASQADKYFSNLKHCVSFIPLVQKSENCHFLKKKLIECFESFIQFDGSENDKISINSILEIEPNTKLKDDTIQKLSSYNDKSLQVGLLLYNNNANIINFKSIIKRSLPTITKTNDFSTIEKAMIHCMPHDNSFYNLIFDIYNCKTFSSIKAACNILKSLKEPNEKKEFTQKISEKMISVEENDFCYVISKLILEYSNNPKDFLIVIPSNIGMTSVKFQCYVIGCAIQFWLRLRFNLDHGMMHRLSSLSQSYYREVRIRIAEFFAIITEK